MTSASVKISSLSLRGAEYKPLYQCEIATKLQILLLIYF